jgi:hypothetical protein
MSQLNLKIPENATQAPAPKQDSKGWKIFISAGVICAAVGAWMPKGSVQPSTASAIAPPTAATSLPYSDELLLRLTKAGAWSEAAKAIDASLHAPELSVQRKAELHLKKGEFLQNADQHEAALTEYYRADLLPLKDEDIQRKIHQSVIDTLRVLKRYDAIGDELNAKNRQRQGDASGTQDPVVAKVDGLPIHMSQFRKQVDLTVQQQLNQAKAQQKKPEELNQLEEQLRQQYSAPGEQWNLLQQYVSQQVMIREAEAWKLEEHPDFIQQMETIRGQLLAQLLFQTKVEPKDISEMDLKNYIESNRESLGLSTEPGQLSPQDLQNAMPKAEMAYTQLKREENQQAFQKSLMERHKVEVFREAFTEGAR